MTLAVRVDGAPDAPPLVLLDSIGSTTEMWTPCLAPLAERFRVLRIDTRGHGGSAPIASDGEVTIGDLAEDVLTALDELGVRQAGFAGLSLGGMVALWIAVHRPERVSRLALLCTSAYVGDPGLWRGRAAAVRADGTAAIADAVVARWLTPGLAARDPELLAALRAMVASVDGESYAQCSDAIRAMDQSADLGRVAAPTLVIGGAEDPALPVPHQQAIADGIAGARLVVLADAAHVPTYEQPGRVADLLVRHFGAGTRVDDTGAAGDAMRRTVLGDAHVDAAVAATTPLTAGFQQFITRYAWGEIWTGPELTRRERSVATLAALTALGAEHELVLHVRGALRNGLTPEQIVAVLQHTAVYGGVPRANRAISLARTVLDEETS